MDLDEVETTEKKSKKKDKKKRSAAEADTGNDTITYVVDASCAAVMYVQPLDKLSSKVGDMPEIQRHVFTLLLLVTKTQLHVVSRSHLVHVPNAVRAWELGYQYINCTHLLWDTT